MSETFINHAITFYKALEEKAEYEKFESKDRLVFTGKVTEVFKETGISETYYSPLVSSLKKHGCILYLVRGSAGNPSRVALYGLPPADEWQVDGWKDGGSKKGLTKRAESATMLEEVKELRRLQGGINTVDALIELERRIEKLSDRISSLEEKVSS